MKKIKRKRQISPPEIGASSRKLAVIITATHTRIQDEGGAEVCETNDERMICSFV